MTEPSARGSHGDPRHVGPGAETPTTGGISGFDVSVTYDLNEIGISWNSKDRAHLAFQDAAVSARISSDTAGDDLVWLRLNITTGSSRLAVDLPFYGEQLGQLRTFADALNTLFPGRTRPNAVSVEHDTMGPHDVIVHRPPGEAAMADRGHPDGSAERERQAVPVVTIKMPPPQSADDNDWISLCPPTETQRMLQPSYREPATPEPTNSQLG
jgi:hypothetical protein